MNPISGAPPDFLADLTVIIVNYNAAYFLKRCLESVFAQDGVRFEVLVVDNASTDHSRNLIQESFPKVHLIANSINMGFSRANNQALESAAEECIYFLNPDTEVQPGAFSRMVAYLSVHPEVGIAGTRIVNPDGSSQSSVEWRYPGGKHGEKELKMRIGFPTGDMNPIAWVLGASMVGRRSLLREIGGFDERFFLYGEDADICLRVRQAGFRVGFIPEAVILHWGGQSERGHHRLAVWEKKVHAETLFYNKHYSKATCRRIHREGLLQAYWRLLTLEAETIFWGKKEKNLEKWLKYRAVARGYRWNP